MRIGTPVIRPRETGSVVSAERFNPDGASAGHNRLAFATVGVTTLCLLLAERALRGMPLAYDEWYRLLVRLMWTGNESLFAIPRFLLIGLQGSALAVGTLLLLAAIWPKAASRDYLAGLIRAVYPAALIVPTTLLSITVLGRVTANLVYSGDSLAWVNLTAIIAHIEGDTTAHLQQAFVATHQGQVIASLMYSLIWICALIVASTCFLALGDYPGASDAVVGSWLLCALAIPFFILVPVNDPWSVNPIYGYGSNFGGAAVFAYPEPSAALLRYVAIDARRIVASGLPSLHVALPAMITFIARHRGHRWLARVFASVTLATAFAAVLLGRHWITDCALAVVFAYFGFRCLIRTKARISLPPLQEFE